MVNALQVMWAVCVYIEAVSVLPQLRMMQKAKVVEKFTAHYVFALGVSRFISCAHWILQIIDGDSFLLQAIGSGIWPAMVLLSEIVQTGILADFWYDVVAVCFVVAHDALCLWPLGVADTHSCACMSVYLQVSAQSLPPPNESTSGTCHA